MEILLLILIVAGFVILIAGARVSRSSHRPKRHSGSSNNYIYPDTGSSCDYGSTGGDYGSSSGGDCGGGGASGGY